MLKFVAALLAPSKPNVPEGNKTYTTFHKAQPEERMRLAGLWEDRRLVFPNQAGKTMSGVTNPTVRSFKPLLERAGLPHYSHVLPDAGDGLTKAIDEALD